MDRASKSYILTSLKNGTYYEDAKKWYLSKFIVPYVERNILILFTSFFFLAMLIVAFFYQKIESLDFDTEFITSTPDISLYYSVINRLGDDKANPQELIEDFQTKLYITKRESYDFDKVKEQSEFIKNNSTKEIGDVFEQLMSINNPNSPLLLYQRENKKSVEIISLQRDPKERNTCNVKFSISLFSDKNVEIVKSFNNAKITYTISPISDLIKQRSPSLDYKVTKYSVEKLN